MKKFTVYLCGDSRIFGEYETLEEAQDKIEKLEEQDKIEDCYENDSYEIVIQNS